MKNNIRRLLNLLFVTLMFMTLPGFSKTIEAIEADTKNLEVGATYFLGDTISLGEGQVYIEDVDYQGSPAQYGDHTLPASLESSNCINGQWIIALSNGLTLYLGKGSASADRVPIGIKCNGGEGTESKPYTFELVYAVVLEVGEGHGTLANSIYTKYGEKAVSISGTTISLYYPSSTTYEEVVTELATIIYGLIDQLNPIDNNELLLCLGTKPLSGYESYLDAAKEISNYTNNETIIGSNGVTLYLLWTDQLITEVELMIDNPAAGTIVTGPSEIERMFIEQTPVPNVYIVGDKYNFTKQGEKDYAFWLPEVDDTTVEDGTYSMLMKEGKSYRIIMSLKAAQDYYFANPIKVVINGKVFESTATEVSSGITGSYLSTIYPIEAVKDELYVSKGDNQTWYKGSTSPLSVTFKRTANDGQLINLFRKIRVGENEVNEKDGEVTNYRKSKGSVVIDLQPEYLNNLSVGTHTLTAEFDGEKTVSIDFKIAEKSSDSSSSESTTPVYRFPKTGIE